MSSTTSPAAERLARLDGTHFWFLGRDVLVRTLLDRLAAPDPILDLGCGTGRFAAALGAEGRSVVALDSVPFLQPELVGLGVTGDAERLCLRAGAVGTVLARDILEHVDDHAALAECHRVLRPGGILVVLVPAWPSLWSDRDVRAGHRRRYRRAGIRAQVARAGFEVLEVRGYQFALLPITMAVRVCSRLIGPKLIDREERASRPLNKLLGSINRFEASLARWRGPYPPTGSTLVVVARRP